MVNKNTTKKTRKARKNFPLIKLICTIFKEGTSCSDTGTAGRTEHGVEERTGCDCLKQNRAPPLSYGLPMGYSALVQGVSV